MDRQNHRQNTDADDRYTYVIPVGVSNWKTVYTDQQWAHSKPATPHSHILISDVCELMVFKCGPADVAACKANVFAVFCRFMPTTSDPPTIPTTCTLQTLVVALVHFRLDYGNGVLGRYNLARIADLPGRHTLCSAGTNRLVVPYQLSNCP